MNVVFGIIYIGLFVSALTIFAHAIYCFYRAITSLRADKSVFSNLVAPIAIFIPTLFTEDGNKYRKKFFISLVLGAAVLSLVFIIRYVMNTFGVYH